MAHSALPFKPGSASARLLSWQWSFVRQATLAVCFVALYFLLTLSNVILVDRLGANVWYPALGLGFALMVGLSPAYAPLIMLVDVIASVRNYHQPMTAWATILGTPVNTAIYAVAAGILRSSAHFDSALKRRRDISIYALVTLNAAVLCSLVGAACLVGDGSVPRSEYWPTVLGWYTGDTISLLGAAPFLLVHVFPWIRWQLSRAAGLRMEQKRSEVKPARSPSEFLELAGQAGSIIVVLWVIYPSPLGPLQLYYLVLLPVIWIALRQGIARVTAGILAVNLGTALCQGVYTRDFQSPLKLGVLMLVVAFTGLIVGSAVSERFHADQCLREQSAYLNLLIANSPFGIVVVDADLRISLCNAAFASLFNSQDKDLFGKGLDSLVLENEETEKLHNAAMQVFAGATVNQVVEHHRADGLVSQLELHAVPLEQAGQVRQAYAIYKDITEQVEAENAARQHADSLRRGIEELQRRTAQMGLMNQMGDFLQCCADVKEAYAVFTRFGPLLFSDAESGMLFSVRASRQFADSVVSWGNAHLSEPVFDLSSCWSLRRGTGHWSHSAEPIICTHVPRDSPFWFLCLPMIAQGETMGILHLQFPAQLFGSGDVEAQCASRQRLAANVGGQLAASLASLNLRQKLRDQSLKDPLTGLFNRRAMQEALHRELHRAQRKQCPLSLLMIDLDHFKQFNDNFGHEAGDLVLQTMAQVFLNHFRAEDVVCRFGGEEFTVILPDASTEDATKRAVALCAEARKIVIHHNGQNLESVTLSIGVAGFPAHGKAGADLLRSADEALYQSKAMGRNRVTAASRPLTDGTAAVSSAIPVRSPM